MITRHRTAGGIAGMLAGGVFAVALAGPAQADLYGKPMTGLELSANVAVTTDYVFRGVSQTDESAAIQGGFDATYGMFYLGLWASSLDFGGAVTPAGQTVDIADVEIDYYGGIKKSWNGVEFDIGFIYYTYPNAFDPGAELNYWEIKGAVSGALGYGFDGGLTVYYSPDYTGETGDTLTVEGSLSRDIFKGLTLSGTLGYIDNLDNTIIAGTDTEYLYWSIGLEKTFHDKFTLGVAYWDTDASGCKGLTVFQCDERVVGTLSASF